MNKVTLYGRLGRDPELRYTKSGKPVANLSVATSKKRKDGSGELIEETQWHRVTVWGSQAEPCGKYLAKGSEVLLTGEIRYSTYEKDGQTRYSTEIHADSVTFVGGRGGSGGDGHRGKSSGGYGQDEPEPYDPGAYTPTGPEEDDIPF